jgi:hypothetical protein
MSLPPVVVSFVSVPQKLGGNTKSSTKREASASASASSSALVPSAHLAAYMEMEMMMI